MIVSWLTGGLGNQMFQYAAGVALARARQVEHKVDISWYRENSRAKAHERYALGALNVRTTVATRAEIEQTRGTRPRFWRRWTQALAATVGRRKPAAPGNWHAPDTFGYYPGFQALPDNTYLHGMFQSEQFFANAADVIRDQFTLRDPPPLTLEPLAASIRRGPSAFVHVRRGDYVNDPRYAREIGALGSDYYRRAIASLRSRHPAVKLFIFSDDIETVAREFAPDGPHEFVREPAGTPAHHVLWLMSLCQHAIIANSTLGWWGAWLGEKPGQVVIGPRRWFAEGSPHDSRDILPARWERQ